MADCRMWNILKAIEGKVKQDFTGGHSEVDMRKSVVIGLTKNPPELPWACVSIDGEITEIAKFVTFSSRPVYQVFIFTGGDDTEEMTKNALNLGADIKASVMSDQFLDLGGGVIDQVLASYVLLSGSQLDMPNVPVVGYLEIVTPFESETGI